MLAGCQTFLAGLPVVQLKTLLLRIRPSMLIVFVAAVVALVQCVAEAAARQVEGALCGSGGRHRPAHG